MRTVLEFEGERFVMTHPCQQCGIETEAGDLCRQCLIDSHIPDNDEPEHEEYLGEECGRWVNGRLGKQCSLAGTEFCDWECPYGD